MIDTCKHVCAKKNKPALIVSQSRQCIIRGQKKNSIVSLNVQALVMKSNRLKE